ncbi:MAG: 3-isopropylmalate dehydratase small subunit [Gammaproteobacteria bacterium]|nr:3-isopropylmalate dehydratase small subunit [Gammaproteobacteria bacterium]
MEAFTQLAGIVAPLDRANVDTDTIIPKQYLKSIRRTGFGPNLFDLWRYLDKGEPGQDSSTRRLNPDFILNQPRYRGAQILLARKNFGCGSSREHAVWALLEYGIRAMLAPSVADIFYSNAIKNGFLPIVLDAHTIDRLFKDVEATPGYRLTIDLVPQTVTTPKGEVIHFDVDQALKHQLLHGLDDIDMTLRHADHIRAYEARRRKQAPWLFTDLDG